MRHKLRETRGSVFGEGEGGGGEGTGQEGLPVGTTAGQPRAGQSSVGAEGRETAPGL